MSWWGKRKRAANSKRTTLSIEPLEDRNMMAAIPLLSGQAVSFHDADGTHVKVKLVGPGSGTIELDGGVLTGADIDSIVLNDTTGASKLKISTRGGTIKGTTINDLVINKALNEVGALKKFTGRKVDFLDGGEFTADGGIEHIRARSLGGDVNVDGDVKKFKANSLDTDATVDVSGVIKEFVAKLLGSGSALGAHQIDMLNIKDQAQGTSVEVGIGGLTQAKIKNIYDSSIATEGMIGGIVVKGDAMGAAFASNINMGSDERYGTIDDFVVDRSATGYIQSVKLKGAVGGDGAQKVKIISSGQVGNVEVSASAIAQGNEPMIWLNAASSFTPLSIVQQSLNATGFEDDEIYVAIFGQEIMSGSTSGKSYYLKPGTPGTLPTLTAVSTLPAPSSTTPNLVTLPSYTLSQWEDATQFWNSQLNFPTPPPTEEWTGRIVISAGAPVQAQVAADGTVTAPSASNPVDPATGTFYDFVEFTVTADASGNPTLDADTSQVDAFGMPMSLQFWQPNATYFAGTTNGSVQTPTSSITGIASTAGLTVGQSVFGPGVPSGTTISTITPNQGMTPGSITVNTSITTSTTAGNFTALTPPWEQYDYTFNGVATKHSNIITGVTNIQTLVTQQYFGFGQPVIASGILGSGTVVTDYDIVGQTITLNQGASESTPSMPTGNTTTFTYEVAGPVGVAADRDVVVSPTNSSGLTNFLQLRVNGGNDQARPFLQSTAPFLANGPVPLSGATNNGSAIQILTSGTVLVQAGDQIEVDGVLGNTAANGVFQVASTTSTSITLGSPIANAPYTSGGTWSFAGAPVTNATTSQAAISANPSDITNSGVANGDQVTISGVGGNTAVNGTFLVDTVGSSSFNLTGPVLTTSQSLSGSWQLAGSSNQVTFTSSATAGGLITLTTNSAGLVADDVIQITGTGVAALDNNYFVIASPTGTGFTLGSPAGSSAFSGGGTWTLDNTNFYNVTGATRGGQVVITTNSTTGLSSGDSIAVSNVQGNTAANGTYNISGITSTTFTLDGTLSNGFYIANTGTWTQSSPSTYNITGASNGPIVISTANTDNLANGDQVTISGVQGNTAANGTFVVSNVVPNTSFQLANPVGNATYQEYGTWSMSVVDAANSVITTGDTTGLNNGDFVNIIGVLGNLAVNGEFVVGNVTPNSFALVAPVGNVPAAGQGGTWNLQGSSTTYTVSAVSDINQPIIITTTAASGDMPGVGDIINITNTVGNSAANGLFAVSAVNGSQIWLGGPVSITAFAASSGTWTGVNGGTGFVNFASKGDDITIVTASTAGLGEGMMVEVLGVQGNSSANNVFYVGELTGTTFSLVGTPATSGYINGGTWRQYASLNRLVSPKDLAESITDPADESAINNYFNDLIDDFFLQYFSGTIGIWNGGDQTFEIVSTAWNGTPITYSGTFKQVTITDQTTSSQAYQGYALSLSETGASPADPYTYNIVYPWFNTNAPSPDVYSPLFGTTAAPTWIVASQQQAEAASQMIFACDAVFADNVARVGIDIKASDNSVKVLGDLEDSLAAAFNRGIIMNDPSTWSDTTTWYQAQPDGPNTAYNAYNYWAQYWHQSGTTSGDLAYAFPYDDKYGLSTNLEVKNAGLAQITLGNWSATKQAASAFTLTSNAPSNTAPAQSSVSFTATISGTSGTPTGHVAFFLDGISLNTINSSSSPPLELHLLAPTVANTSAKTSTFTLPPTSDATNEHTYTVTAVYTGDGTFLPTVSSMQLTILAAS